MTTIVTRSGKGSPLTHVEVDANFTNLNNDKSETTHTHTSSAVTDFTEAAQDAVGAMIDASLTYVDATPLLQRAALTGAVTASAGSNATALGSFTMAQLSTAVSDGDPLYGPAGSTTQIQYNNAGTLAGASSALIEGNELRLPAISTPTTPAASGAKVYGMSLGGRITPAFLGADGKPAPIQTRQKARMEIVPIPGSSSPNTLGCGLSGTTGTAATVATTNLHALKPRVDRLITVAATTAIATARASANRVTVGGASAGLGGFRAHFEWGPATGVTIATHRAFVGMKPTAAPTDVNPSTLLNIVGMGWDNGDTNVQMMHNDGSGTATKIDLGASFPRPSVDRTDVYELELYSPPGTTQTVGYRVVNLVSGAIAEGTISTNMPSTTQLLAPDMWMSVGGTSSVIGFAEMGWIVEWDY